jgi:hypothetical protein
MDLQTGMGPGTVHDGELFFDPPEDTQRDPEGDGTTARNDKSVSVTIEETESGSTRWGTSFYNYLPSWRSRLRQLRNVVSSTLAFESPDYPSQEAAVPPSNSHPGAFPQEDTRGADVNTNDNRSQPESETAELQKPDREEMTWSGWLGQKRDDVICYLTEQAVQSFIKSLARGYENAEKRKAALSSRQSQSQAWTTRVWNGVRTTAADVAAWCYRTGENTVDWASTMVPYLRRGGGAPASEPHKKPISDSETSLNGGTPLNEKDTEQRVTVGDKGG